MKTVEVCNFSQIDSQIIIKAFNAPANPIFLDLVDQVDTSQFDGTWTSPYWPTLKAKYDLVMPGEPPSGGPAVPAA